MFKIVNIIVISLNASALHTEFFTFLIYGITFEKFKIVQIIFFSVLK
jgi:hypothetical protein